MIERELKVMLTGEEYATLVMALCKDAKPAVQSNYYFDTEDLSMNKKGITCRIRLKDGVYQATVKSHHAENPEYSTEQDLCESKTFNPDIFNVFGLHCQGELITERFTLYKSEQIEMVLDRNSYLGIVDYELEIEYEQGCKEEAEKGLNHIADLLVCHQLILHKYEFVSRVQKGKSKSERFFAMPFKK